MWFRISNSIRSTGFLALAFAASCSAPISFKQVASKTPQGDFVVSPLAEAFAALEAGKAAKNPLVAGGHFFDCAYFARNQALAGEPGALALYNHAVARLMDRLEGADALPWGTRVELGSENEGRTLRGVLEPGAPAGHREYLSVDGLDFSGKYAAIHASRSGVGAPLVAISEPNPDARKTFEIDRLHVALTAVLRFDNPRSGTLELLDPLEVERISGTHGRTAVLAADFSAPASVAMSVNRPDKLGLKRLLDPQKYSDTARLVRLQKYDPKRIPVLFVHGLQSTPATWAPMYHALLQDDEIRRKYQFWVFSYPSGYPYPYSASLLRRELDGIDAAFPDHQDIVLVGHSMGSLISRLMVTDAGDGIWRSMFGAGPADTKMAGGSRQLLEDSIVFGNRPDIRKVIFYSGPHRGSEIASNPLGRLASRLVHLPGFLTDARNAFASVATADTASLYLERAPNSIDTLAPNNRFVREVNKLPIAPGVTYHTIAGDRGKGDTPDSSDGIVPYWSSHLDGAASEKIVPSGHGSHQDPEGIEEARRILREYAR